MPANECSEGACLPPHQQAGIESRRKGTDVKIRRTVTPKVLEANRENAQKSTGAQTETGKEASSANSVKHGLLADGLVFETDEQEEQFAELMDQLTNDLRPDGTLQSMLVEEIAVCYWKLGLALRWEMAAAHSRRESSRDVVQGLVAENLGNKSQLEFLDSQKVALGGKGWECTELLVRKGRSSESSNSTSIVKRDVKAGEEVHVQVEAKLAPALETTMRYSAMIRRDLHRAIDQLKSLRALEEN
jgi:hypothetical protein